MKLHHDLKVSYKTAWFIVHRLRECFTDDDYLCDGQVKVDETYMDGKSRNMHKLKREQLTGLGPADKVAVVGIKDRATNQVDAQVVGDRDGGTLRGIVT